MQGGAATGPPSCMWGRSGIDVAPDGAVLLIVETERSGWSTADKQFNEEANAGGNAYMGVQGEDSTEPAGARLSTITPDGPAAAASLEVGDIVIGIDDTKIDDYQALLTFIRGAQGDAERLKVTNASLQARIESVENGSKTTKAELAGELATTRAELEGLARELDAERAARETETKELSDALAAAQAKSDDVEAQLATALADAASLKQKLKAQTQGAEDA